MAKRHHHYEVTDEIMELMAETIGEISDQLGCAPQDRMVDIDDDTPEVIPLTARIEERYTVAHVAYFAVTVAD